MPSFIIVGYVWQILGRSGHPWAAPKMPILNRINIENNSTKQSKSKRITFLVTYCPLLKSLQNLINKHLNILYLGKEVFTSGSMATFRRSRKLIIYLRRAKVNPQERASGPWKCHEKSCGLCLNFNKTSIFTSSVALKIYSTNNKFNCKSMFHLFIRLQTMLKAIRRSNYSRFPFSISDFWYKWFIFWNIFLYCKIVIRLLELFLATCFLCILQTQLTRRNTSVPQKFKKHEHMNFVVVSSNDGKSDICQFFFIETFSLLSVQYIYELSCKMDKTFLRYSMFFFQQVY